MKSVEHSGKNRNPGGLYMVTFVPLTRNVTVDKFLYFLGLSFLTVNYSSGMYRERPDSKEGRISQQWLKFRLLFHVTR